MSLVKIFKEIRNPYARITGKIELHEGGENCNGDLLTLYGLAASGTLRGYDPRLQENNSLLDHSINKGNLVRLVMFGIDSSMPKVDDYVERYIKKLHLLFDQGLGIHRNIIDHIKDKSGKITNKRRILIFTKVEQYRILDNESQVESLINSISES